MATVEGNIIMRGAHGTFAGQVVYRQRYGKTIMCKLPKPYPPKTPTQIANQERFKRANDFAKQAMKDPEKKAYYQSIAKEGRSAFNAAFKDAYSKPEVEVTVAEKKVTVKIKAKHRIYMVKGTTLQGKEMGQAVLKGNKWEYILRSDEPIRITVYDIAGNICTKEIKT